MDQKTVQREEVRLKEDPNLLSPPYLAKPYACATAVTVYGFVPHATIEVEVAGATVVTQPVGPTAGRGDARTARGARGEPGGSRQADARHGAERLVRAGFGDRSHQGVPGRSAETRHQPGARLRVRDPDGSREPACGRRCLGHGGRHPGGSRRWLQPATGGQHQPQVRSEPARPSLVRTLPGSEPAIAGTAVRAAAIAPPDARLRPDLRGWRAARHQLHREWRGRDAAAERGEHRDLRLLGRPPAGRPEPTVPHRGYVPGDEAMCPGDPPSPPGTGVVIACSALPAPGIGPLQGGDRQVVVTSSAPGATIKVWVDGVQVGTGSAPLVLLSVTLKLGDTVIVVQDLPGCRGQLALEVKVACVDAPVAANPDALDLFPVGNAEYSDGGAVRGTVYYPAEDDGKNQPFNRRVTNVGRAPIVFMAHGNHCPSTDPSHLGYDYFQIALARMGIVAASVDCNDLNCNGSNGVQNIEDRADRIIDSIRHFQGLDGDLTSTFFQRVDFGRVGADGALTWRGRGRDRGVGHQRRRRDHQRRPRARSDELPVLVRHDDDRPDGLCLHDDPARRRRRRRGQQRRAVLRPGRPGPFRSQVYAHFTNHNFFNRQWLLDEGAGPPRVARAEHERILTAYGSAFYRSVLLGHPTDTYLAGYQKPAGVMTQNIYLSFSKQKQVTVDDHEDGNGIGEEHPRPADIAVGRPERRRVRVRAGAERGPAPGAYNGSFYGQSEGMVCRPGGTARLFRSEIGKMDLRKREIWIRAAEVVDRPGTVPSGASGFRLGVED